MKVADLKKYAYDEIKRNIIYCEYGPGTLLNEQFLTDELGISRTPIREALNRLEQDGLIRTIPKKGILVSEITMADVGQLYQARLQLEPFVVRKAWPRLERERLLYFREKCAERREDAGDMLLLETDTQLHRYFVENCGNKYITELMNKLLDQNTRIQVSCDKQGRGDSVREEDLKIVEYLLEGNVEMAAEAMRDHVESCRNRSFAEFMKLN